MKPDVVTLGEGVLIAGDRVNVNGYSSADGTSFAAPAIAGVIVQLRELFKKYFVTEMLPSTATALLIHTAEDLGNKGPDYQYGWGLPDAKKAALLLNTANNDGVFAVQEFRLMQNVQQHFFVKPQGAGVPIKVTIAWTDPPGIVTEGGPTKSAYKTDPTPKLVHDIDLWVDKIVNGKSVEVYRPWVLDRTVPEKAATRGRNSVDNVEQVIIENPDPNALYRVNVTHAGPFKTPEQLFSRCISGADLYLEPPTPVSASIQNNVEKSGETTQAFNAMVSWPRILQATSYEVRYRKSGTNAWTVKNGISNNSTVLTGLELGTYQIQVRARRGPKVSTYATITKTFTITPKPPTNLLSGPITASTCKVSWTGDGNATGYRVFHARIDKDGKLLDNGWKTSTTTSTSAVLSGLLQDQRYAWSVQSTYPNDVKSESAPTAGFKTSTDCNAYEPNNAIAEAKPVEKGRTIYARACKDDVSDWYSFSVSSQQPNLKVVMYAQPVPLQMALYRMENGSAVKVKDSPDNNNGTGTKVVEANGLQGGSYYLRIFNVNSGSVFSSATPYSFVVTTK